MVRHKKQAYHNQSKSSQIVSNRLKTYDTKQAKRNKQNEYETGKMDTKYVRGGDMRGGDAVLVRTKQ